MSQSPSTTQALPSLSDLRSMEDFPHTSELEAAFGTAIKIMGPRYKSFSMCERNTLLDVFCSSG